MIKICILLNQSLNENARKLYNNLFWRFLFSCLVLDIFHLFVTMWRHLLNYIWDISKCCVSLLFLIDLLNNTVCLMMQVKLTNAPHLSKYFDKNSKDTQQLLISHYISNWVDDVTWLQTKWNISRTKHGNQNLQNKLLYSFTSTFV
jgi:hypothetical protein